VRALRAAPRILSSTSLLALSAAFSPDRALASCTYNRIPTPSGVFALSRDVCSAAAGTYNPTIKPDVPLPVPYTGFGFFAYRGGVIDASGDVTVTTTGTNAAYGFWSDGARAKINSTGQLNVVTNGSASYGYYANGGGAISASDAKIETTGADSPGIYATGSGSNIDVSGPLSILTTGMGSDGIVADAGATITLSGGGQVIPQNNGSHGLAVHGTGSSLTADGLNVNVLGDSISPFDTGAAVTRRSASVSGGGSLTLNNSSLQSNGTKTFGIFTSDGGVTTVNGGSITASGQDSFVVITTGGATTSLSAASITATGLGSTAIEVSGSGSTLNGSSVTISAQGEGDSANGFAAEGVYNGAGFGFTSGGAAKLSDSSISSSGFEQNALLTRDGGTTTIVGGSINTTGNGAYAIVDTAGGLTQLNGASISTTGDGSGGLTIHGAGAEIDATNVSIATQGGYDSASGFHSYGLYNGPFDSDTTGGVAKLTDTSVSTQGAQIYAVLTSTGGTTTILGGVIDTEGAGANAILTENGGATSVGVSAAGPTTLKTTGNSAYAVAAVSGGFATLTGATISATGNGSGGLAINGAGSEIDADHVTITTTGGSDSGTGTHAYGVYNGPPGSGGSGGVAKLTDTSISTQGAQIFGVLTSNRGTTTILGGSVETSGASAHAIVAENGGAVSVGESGPTTIKTTGNDAYGAVATAGGSLSMTGSQLSAIGNGSGGIAVSGAGSNVSATDASIATRGGFDSGTGSGAYGVYNGAYGAETSGGTASLTDTDVATFGSQAFAVLTSTGGTTIISGGSITTSGAGAGGVVTSGGGSTTLDNVAVSTSGQDAHALVVTGSGSRASLGGTDTFATSGDGAIGLYVNQGGALTATSSATITTAGNASPTTRLGAYGIDADGAGSAIKLASATIMTSGAGATGLFASDAASSGSAGSIAISGPLNIKTTSDAAAAVALQGNGASILATGGGTIASAGDAIEFLGGAGQTATFDNFDIANQSGDLIFADPSTSTVNFNNTVANAGANNLLDAAGGSVVTLNANASTLTGAIATDPASTTTVNLTNGSVWNVTRSSVVSNLAIANSTVVFAPPGSGVAFKTLTLGNYTGTGAGLTMNATLAGAGSAADEIVINGGKATGSTLVTIHNIGGPGGQTTGNGIPLVVATNGGTIAADTFALANTPVVGGYKYALEQTNGDWYLVSSPTATQADIANSVNSIARAQQQQIITGRVLGSILLGATEQINCSNCSSGFGAVGSYALGAHGRWSLSDQLTAMGGFSYDEYSASGINVTNAPTFAGSLVYDLVNWGHSRPFFQVGAGATPYEQVRYSRSYLNGLTTGTGYGDGVDRSLAIFGRAGWVARVTPIDEAAVYADLSRNWLLTGGYTEGASAANPYPATVQNGLAALNVARVGAQYTHLFFGRFEVNVSAAVAYGFGLQSGSLYNVYDFGTVVPSPIGNSTWFEYGGRIGYRVGERFVIDAFLLGTAGGIAGSTVHGGLGLRYLF
jgi:hypothetical protein